MQDKLITHQIYIQRFSNKTFKDLLPQLRQLRDKISLKLLSSPTVFSQERLSIILKEINALIKDDVNKLITPSLFEEFAVYEYEFAIKLLDDTTLPSVAIIGTGIAPAQLLATYTKEKMMLSDKALTIDEAIATFSSRYQKDIKETLQLGLLEGETTQQLASRIKELSNNRTKAQGKALIQTIANHVGSVAREQVWKENEKLFTGMKYVAVLDSHTTVLCASRDGKVYPFDNYPHTPAHYHCRSFTRPEIKPEYRLVKDTTRQSADGQVSSKLTYSGWLRGQSSSVQDEILGQSRAKLFRSGKLTLDKFVDDTGKLYTLKDLKAKDLIK